MRILGIDPGIERLGGSIIDQHNKPELISSGVKKTSSKLPVEQRLYDIFLFLNKLIASKKPDIVSIERLFFSSNAKTAIVIGEVRGAILIACQKNHCKTVEFAPLEVKMVICGNGNASKKEIARMVGFSVDLPKRKMLDDETDAIAIGLSAIYKKTLY